MNSPDSKEDKRILYLHEIHIKFDAKIDFRVKLQVDGRDVATRQDEHAAVWSPIRDIQVIGSSNIAVILKSGHTIKGIEFRKREARVNIGTDEAMEAFWDSKILESHTTFDGQAAVIKFKLRPSHTLETIHERLVAVQEAMKDHKPLMERSTEQHIEAAIKYAVVLAELDPMSKLAFGLVKVTFELLKEQNHYDEAVSGLAGSIERILPFAERALGDLLNEEAEVLVATVEKLYNLIAKAANFICEYVKKSTANKLRKIPEDRKIINELQEDLKRMREDLDRAVSGAILRAASNVEKDLLLKRLKPIDKANYRKDRECMSGTRTTIINNIVEWAKEPATNDTTCPRSNVGNVFWLYGMPGIGKTSVAHSICHLLHESKHLGGSFFCRRDDPILAEPNRILPTLIYRLAGMFEPYRKIVAQTLRDDPHLTPESASGELLLKALEPLKEHARQPLVLVIDAFDECGTSGSRNQLLSCLTKACKSTSWLKLILTSRPERDIQAFFEEKGSTNRDLATDDKTDKDMRYFVQKRVVEPAVTRGLPKDWPSPARLEQIITRSHGLFIYVETFSRLLATSKNPDAVLARVLDKQQEGGSTELHELYLAAIMSQVGQEMEDFRRIARAILGVATYRPLCDDTLASLIGEQPYIVKMWVDSLSSVLYRDHSQNGGIRVRHLSILEFLTSPSAKELRVDLQEANLELSKYCFRKMTSLKFNICKLETSYLPNSEIKDLGNRVEKNIPDALQYSSLHWSGHLTSDANLANKELCELLDEFFAGGRPLYWLEALSLLGNIPAAVSALRLVKKCSKNLTGRTKDRVEDTLRFALAFSTAISTSAPHTYISGLAFIPQESILFRDNSRQLSKFLNVCEGRAKKLARASRSLEGPHQWDSHVLLLL